MIKINLLREEGGPPPPRVSAVGGPPAPAATQVVMLVGALVISFGIVGVIYKVWSNQVADLTKARAREIREQQELAGVKAQNTKYQQRLNDLETRINVIQALQNSRTGPVELMSALGNVVNKTNDVFLFTVTPAGERLSLKGQSGSSNSMASFLAFLGQSGFFDNVQLEQFYQDDIKDHLTYKFSVSCQFKSPTGGTSPTAGAAPALPSGPAMGPGAGPRGTSQGLPPQAGQKLLR
jgi:Tfp pilus assembly protein PilN